MGYVSWILVKTDVDVSVQVIDLSLIKWTVSIISTESKKC